MESGSFFLFVGFSVGTFLCFFDRLYTYPKKTSSKVNLVCIGCVGIISSKVFHYILSEGNLFNFNGGYVFLGFLFPFIICWLFFKQRVGSEFFNVLGICIPFSHSIGRLGCFVNSCCKGDFNDLPVTLLESFFLVCLTIFLLKKYKGKKEDLFFIYMTHYLIFRIFIEFFREDHIRGMILTIPVSQFLSILFLLIIFVKRKFFGQRIQEHIIQT